MAALHLAVVPGRVGADEFVSNAKFLNSSFKECCQLPFTCRKLIGEFKSVVGLSTLRPDAPAGILLDQLFEEISRGIGGLFWVGSQETQTCEFVNSDVLE